MPRPSVACARLPVSPLSRLRVEISFVITYDAGACFISAECAAFICRAVSPPPFLVGHEARYYYLRHRYRELSGHSAHIHGHSAFHSGALLILLRPPSAREKIIFSMSRHSATISFRWLSAYVLIQVPPLLISTYADKDASGGAIGFQRQRSRLGAARRMDENFRLRGRLPAGLSRTTMPVAAQAERRAPTPPRRRGHIGDGGRPDGRRAARRRLAMPRSGRRAEAYRVDTPRRAPASGAAA